MSSRLLPPNRSSLERSLGDVLPAELPVPLRELNDPARCEAALLPWPGRARWTAGTDWSDEAKRNAVATSFVLHQRKGTLTALRQVVEPIGALSEVTEWWQRSPTGVPGTFEITVDVSDRGIDEGTVLELERLLDDVRPVSRHLTRLDLRITPVIRSRHGLAVTDGDTLEIFPGNSDMTTNTPKYGGLLTDIGAAALAAASAAGKMAADSYADRRCWRRTGCYSDPIPAATQTKLINQRYRAQLNRLFVSDKNINTLVAEVVLPVEVGGFWIREIGLQDADGKFVAVSNCPPSYKAAMESGSARTQTIRVNIALSGLENVQLLIDNGIIYATQDWVKEKVAADFKGRKILAGNGLVGGGDLSADRSIGLAPSGVTAGSYRSVTVNANGVVTQGSNPSTLAGYAIGDAYTKADTDGKLAQKANKATTLAGYGITDALRVDGNAVSSSRLAAPRSLAASGDASWSVTFDGSANVSAPLSLSATGVAAGSYPKVTVDTKGRVTAGMALAATDIPAGCFEVGQRGAGRAAFAGIRARVGYCCLDH